VKDPLLLNQEERVYPSSCSIAEDSKILRGRTANIYSAMLLRRRRWISVVWGRRSVQTEKPSYQLPERADASVGLKECNSMRRNRQRGGMEEGMIELPREKGEGVVLTLSLDSVVKARITDEVPSPTLRHEASPPRRS